MKHSSYPWKVMVTEDCKYDIKGPERFIAIDQEHFSNVKLLSQAPEMLDVIKHTRSILMAWHFDLSGGDTEKIALLNTLTYILGTTIEKAEGEQE